MRGVGEEDRVPHLAAHQAAEEQDGVLALDGPQGLPVHEPLGPDEDLVRAVPVEVGPHDLAEDGVGILDAE